MIRNRRWISFLIAALLVVQFAVGGFAAVPARVLAASSGPVISSFSPSNNATNVPTNTKLIFTFDENVKKGTGSAAIQIRKQLDNTVVASYVVASDSKVAISSANHSIVTVTPTSTTLKQNTSYYVTIDSGAFANEGNGAIYAGLSSAVGWAFTTLGEADTDPPELYQLTPALDDITAVDSTLSMVFSEPVFATSGSITITNTAKSTDKQTISVNSPYVTGSGTDTIVVQLPSVLKGDTEYEVKVPSGAFQDASGNKFTGIGAGEWRFTTTEPPLGTVILTPADNAFGVPVDSNLVLSFPGQLDVNTSTPAKTIKIKRISDNSTFQSMSVTSSNVTTATNDETGGTDIIIDPTNNLSANTGYYVLIDAGAFIDSSDQLYEGISDATAWNFTTNASNDVTPPTLLSNREPLSSQASTTIKLVMNFSENVYQDRGNITIHSYPSGAVFATYDVRSSNVSGGGTTAITVTDSTKKFTNGQSYYVEIDGQAFSDSNGNYYAGLSSQTGWKFSVTSDTTKPSIVTLTPATAAVDVPVTGARFEVLFSEQIQIGNLSGVKLKKVSGTGNSPIATTLSIDSTNNRRLFIDATGLMSTSSNYYVEIASDAVTDMAGNNFNGILNTYQWTFKTSSSTTGAPTVSKMEIVGSTKIAITYNENLDTTSAATPAPANYYVTVNGSSRAVTAVSISGKVVTLTLQGSVSYTQAVKVSYSQGATPVKDLTGTLAASFSNQSVTNVQDSTAPKQLSGSVDGNLVTLIMSEELTSISSYAYTQFTIKVDGSSRTVSQVIASGDALYITYSGKAATSSQVVTLSYSAGSYPIRDLSSNALASFSNFSIQNGVDTTAPILQSVTSTGSTVTLNYDEELDTSYVPPVSSYYVTVNSVTRSVSYVRVSGSQVILTLTSAAASSESVLVSYLGSSPWLRDLNGNTVAVFSSMQANASSSTGTMALNGMIAKGDKITLTFDSSLNTAYQPSTSLFAVKVNGTARPISAAAVSGSTVVLTLYTPINVGDTVTVSYSTSNVGIRSTSGATAASFTDKTAANQTTWDDSTSGDYTSAPGGGLGIKTSAATTSSAVSPAGNGVNQFALTAETINNAYNTIRKTGGMEPKAVFTVPTTERAAMVALPLAALESVKKATPNASFVIAYQNVTYEIPLSALNYTQLGQMMNAASAVGQLVVSIDTNAGTLATPLTTQLNSARVQTLVNPVSFDIAVSSNGQTKHVDDFSGYLTRTIQTSAGLDGRQIAVVWLDPQSGKISYAPTQVTQENGQSVVSFKRKGNSVYAVVKGSVTYTDITKHWARNDILLLANKFIVEGNTLTTFAPNKAITRGEFAMFIAKGLGLTGDRSAAAKFKDVNTNTILAAYIGAASKAGIVQGMTDGSFKPNNSVTRQEMASMMVRAASAAGVQIVPKQTTANVLKKFTDRTKIGTWAQTDVAKAVEAGVINGMSNGTFGGKNNATRAEAAVMVKRLLNYLGFINI